jgi:hypothetical protein
MDFSLKVIMLLSHSMAKNKQNYNEKWMLLSLKATIFFSKFPYFSGNEKDFPQK